MTEAKIFQIEYMKWIKLIIRLFCVSFNALSFKPSNFNWRKGFVQKVVQYCEIFRTGQKIIHAMNSKSINSPYPKSPFGKEQQTHHNPLDSSVQPKNQRSESTEPHSQFGTMHTPQYFQTSSSKWHEGAWAR